MFPNQRNVRGHEPFDRAGNFVQHECACEQASGSIADLPDMFFEIGRTPLQTELSYLRFLPELL